jgi:hypothetical protein
MFGVLAKEKHARKVSSDHLTIMREAATDVYQDDDPANQEIDVSELDTVMDDDGDKVSQADIDALDAMIGTLATDPAKNVNEMTRQEISDHVAGLATPTIDQLDQ